MEYPTADYCTGEVATFIISKRNNDKPAIVARKPKTVQVFILPKKILELKNKVEYLDVQQVRKKRTAPKIAPYKGKNKVSEYVEIMQCNSAPLKPISFVLPIASESLDFEAEFDFSCQRKRKNSLKKKYNTFKLKQDVKREAKNDLQDLRASMIVM